MADGCPAKCAKFMLIAFNILFWICGAVLLGIGIWLRVDDSILQYFNIINVAGNDQWFNIAAYVLIGVGAFTFVTGFAGCCGAIRESPCLLGVYIFLLVIIMLVEITAGVLAFVFRNQIETLVTKELGETFMKENYTAAMKDGNITYSGFGTSLNLFQQEFKCCGINGTGDYSVVKDSDVFKNRIPYACCVVNDPKRRADPQKKHIDDGECTEAKAFSKGCQESLKDWLNRQSMILIGLGIGIGCLEIFGIIIACCFCRNAGKDD